ncbi:hypothetical protein WHI96_26635 [Pseudonocardia tropica]|uniref:Uncharacterized protein n=2 Tax=Pseudonocardia TaxID=1847 RepID=A0ABV1K2C5_9PSEU|nr:hypothetical protein [Pseudonocardia sediminis]
MAGALRLADEVRPESRQAIEALYVAGAQVVMVADGARAVADGVAYELDIDQVLAGVTPGARAASVAELKGDGPQERWLVTESTTLRPSRGPTWGSLSAGPTSRSGPPASPWPRRTAHGDVGIELFRASYREMR